MQDWGIELKSDGKLEKVVMGTNFKEIGLKNPKKAARLAEIARKAFFMDWEYRKGGNKQGDRAVYCSKYSYMELGAEEQQKILSSWSGNSTRSFKKQFDWIGTANKQKTRSNVLGNGERKSKTLLYGNGGREKARGC